MAEIKPVKKQLVLVTIALEVENPSQNAARLEAFNTLLKGVDSLQLPAGMKLVPGMCHSTVTER